MLHRGHKCRELLFMVDKLLLSIPLNILPSTCSSNQLCPTVRSWASYYNFYLTQRINSFKALTKLVPTVGNISGLYPILSQFFINFYLSISLLYPIILFCPLVVTYNALNITHSIRHHSTLPSTHVVS